MEVVLFVFLATVAFAVGLNAVIPTVLDDGQQPTPTPTPTATPTGGEALPSAVDVTVTLPDRVAVGEPITMTVTAHNRGDLPFVGTLIETIQFVHVEERVLYARSWQLGAATQAGEITIPPDERVERTVAVEIGATDEPGTLLVDVGDNSMDAEPLTMRDNLTAVEVVGDRDG
jgi:hypothetical protein